MQIIFPLIVPLQLAAYNFFCLSSLFEIESVVYTHFRRCMLSGERLINNLKERKNEINLMERPNCLALIYPLILRLDLET